MTAYYNEHDPYAAQWLRNLIAAGHIAPGEVDERSILDVKPDDLRGFTQCHFFAGIGVWSHALRRAGWPDDRPVWTGSCPCQPFSSAGMARGFADERHLWPIFHFLIEECRPRVVFGEQVASKDGLAWLDLVHADMEGTGYALAAVDLCAAGVGAPHIRQRLWFVAERLADADYERRGEEGHARAGQWLGGGLPPSWMGDDDDARLEGLGGGHQAEGGRLGAVRPVAEASELGGLEYCACDGREQRGAEPGGWCLACGCRLGGVADDLGAGRKRRPDSGRSASEAPAERGEGVPNTQRRSLDDTAGPTNGHWRDADWLSCRDGKWRPVEPGTFPLAHGAAARVGRLRAYGNAIVPQVAAEVIAAYMECRP